MEDDHEKVMDGATTRTAAHCNHCDNMAASCAGTTTMTVGMRLDAFLDSVTTTLQNNKMTTTTQQHPWLAPTLFLFSVIVVVMVRRRSWPTLAKTNKAIATTATTTTTNTMMTDVKKDETRDVAAAQGQTSSREVARLDEVTAVKKDEKTVRFSPSLSYTSAAPPPKSADDCDASNIGATDDPEPRWHIFRWVNFAAVAVLGWIVADLGTQYYRGQGSHPHHPGDRVLHDDPTSTNEVQQQPLLKFLAAWSLLLCYFFGFFGVSIVHDLAGGVDDEQDAHNNEEEEAEGNNRSSHHGIADKGIPAEVVEGRDLSTTSSMKLQPPSLPHVPEDSPFEEDKGCERVTMARETRLDMSRASLPSNVSTRTLPLQPDRPTALDEDLSDGEIAQQVLHSQIKDHELEKRVGGHRAVRVRRLVVQHKLSNMVADVGRKASEAVLDVPHLGGSVDYDRIHGVNCEVVIGYVPIPLGVVGPLVVNGRSYYVPMATTEGCLVASCNRGAKAITQGGGGGAYAEVVRDGISRAPCVRMPTARDAANLKRWCERSDNFDLMRSAFSSTTSFGRLQSCSPTIAGRNVYLRLVCTSGDAMGMNMVSKGSLAVIELLKTVFPSMELVALSGNMCTDKKAAATNWLEGRGKSVVVESVISKEVVAKILKTTVSAMVHTNLHKNLIGSAMAGSLGGFNAHASNVVTAIFLATGQDPAQNVESSNCITLLEETDDGDLWMSCTMPSVEVGTVGGGTSLSAQSACLRMMGLKAEEETVDDDERTTKIKKAPGDDACELARIVAAATMAGELSLLAALAANTLVAAHMKHNRKVAPSTTATTAS